MVVDSTIPEDPVIVAVPDPLVLDIVKLKELGLLAPPAGTLTEAGDRLQVPEVPSVLE
jgi:hypothetical protein